MTATRKAAETGWLAAFATGVVNILLLGLVLMVFVPLVGVTLGLPEQHPGYWLSTAFGALAKALLGMAGDTWRATSKSK